MQIEHSDVELVRSLYENAIYPFAKIMQIEGRGHQTRLNDYAEMPLVFCKDNAKR